MRLSFKPGLPRSLYGRAALILVLPIVTIQLIVSIAFIQRHFEGVTRQLSRGVIYEIQLIRQELADETNVDRAFSQASETADAFGMQLALTERDLAASDRSDWDDLTAGVVFDTLRAGLTGIYVIDLSSMRGGVILTLESAKGPIELIIPRPRISASNPHQLLVIMGLASILMTFIAYVFLRNQLRPIARLAVAAEAFGKGDVVSYRPRGATEVRAAGAAFLDMRAKIERAIETRTMMLSGISHDLRTPLTRLRLGLSLLPPDDDVDALMNDVSEMERMVDEFLAFARGDAMEEPVGTDPLALLHRVVENATRAGLRVDLEPEISAPKEVRLRPQAVARALENLVGNACRHGKTVTLGLKSTEKQIRFIVEDDGPGIPDAQRERAVTPFARLDDSRNMDRRGGAGLGLAIVADIARSHGGSLVLGKSEALGGLRAELRLAR
ncbi:ATP-binding protein [Thioclava sp. FR2]|uniref:ATP-binding protein n=1 Tax=Thioclava sp. FR2 TaxID=3445780 RepID=UPI003EC08580